MSRRFTRRRWMLSGLAAGVALALGGRHWRRLRQPAAGDLAGFIRDRLSHLNLDPSAPDAFSEEYTRRFGPAVMAVHSRLTFGGLVSGATLRRISDDRARRAVDLERRLVSDFLRSSTYFREPTGSLVRFVAYPDPYEGPCTNPFADLTSS